MMLEKILGMTSLGNTCFIAVFTILGDFAYVTSFTVSEYLLLKDIYGDPKWSNAIIDGIIHHTISADGIVTSEMVTYSTVLVSKQKFLDWISFDPDNFTEQKSRSRWSDPSNVGRTYLADVVRCGGLVTEQEDTNGTIFEER